MARAAVAERLSLRRRLARLKESGNLGWSAAALLISLIALLPILAIAVIALQAERRYLAASDRKRAAGGAPPHATADGRRRQL